VTTEALKVEIAALIDDPELREEWLNTSVPNLEPKHLKVI
tara:strand:- start:160 stop:279 length:120 start_codon:yes stop_codon:yes gene_type:complete